MKSDKITKLLKKKFTVYSIPEKNKFVSGIIARNKKIIKE